LVRCVSFLLFLITFSPAVAAVDISVDAQTQRMSVWVDGVFFREWPVSTGAAGYETPAGSFKAFRLEREHYSQEWDNAPMPYSIFFTQAGHAIHGTQNVDALGQPASHGCVRLATQHAEELFAIVDTHGVESTRVEIFGSANQPMHASRPSSFETLGDDRRPRIETIGGDHRLRFKSIGGLLSVLGR
jgi:hypothetical protein